jgi:hypothetical protein
MFPARQHTTIACQCRQRSPSLTDGINLSPTFLHRQAKALIPPDTTLRPPEMKQPLFNPFLFVFPYLSILFIN